MRSLAAGSAPKLEELGRALESNRSVVELLLTDNRVGPVGVAKLAPSLGAVRYLELAKCQLGAEGIKTLSALLQSGRLVRLDVSLNAIGPSDSGVIELGW